MKKKEVPYKKPKEKCPLCGCKMLYDSPQLGKNGQVLYYRRLKCSECPHVQSHSYKKMTSEQRAELKKEGLKIDNSLVAVEIDQIENSIGQRYAMYRGYAGRKRKK